MKTILALAATAAISIAAPAFAQEAGAPGAVGSIGGLSGSNTPGSGQDSQRVYSDGYSNNGWNNNGWGPAPGVAANDGWVNNNNGWASNAGGGWYNNGYNGNNMYYYNGRDGLGYYNSAGVFQGPRMDEGRAAANDMTPPPRHIRGAMTEDDDQ